MSALRVLVVDDDGDNADSTAVLVRLWGHDAQVAKDGKTALMVAETFCPDVVLFDLAMPGMSGIELATKLRACLDQSPPLLVAITGYGDKNTRVGVLAAGAHLHLVKPVLPDDLKGMLDRMLHEDVADPA